MPDSINFDIVGGCNAKCPLCVTARTSFGQRIESISVQDFSRSLDRLIELGVAIPGRTRVQLYSWGEPILHPDLNGISNALRERNLMAVISTNASKKTIFTESTSHFADFVFSVPGWSQASYDKIHGLKFDRIVANMEATISNMRQTGFRGNFILSFHVYQFNLVEMAAARQWCAKNGVFYQAYAAYLNDYEPAKRYLEGTLPEDTLKYLSKRVFLHYVDDLIASKPAGWKCPQWDDIFNVNHKMQVLLCCTLPPGHQDYALGSLFDLTAADITRLKRGAKECDTCMSTGLAYWGHNAHMFERVSPPGPAQRSPTSAPPMQPSAPARSPVPNFI